MLFSPRSLAACACALASLASVSANALKQFNPRAGGFEDYCGYLDKSLTYTVGKKSFELTVESGLCVDTIKAYIKKNAEAQQAIARGYDANDLLVLIQNALQKSKSYTLCNFPNHGVEDPTEGYTCGFTCSDGFQVHPAKAPTTCVCPAGKTKCNGKCVVEDPNTGGCPSEGSEKKKRGADAGAKSWWIDDRCPTGYSVCGVVNGGPKAWECVDTSSDLWSCGGCSVPFLGASMGLGDDCTAIPHATSVACASAQCSVRACKAGFVPSADAASCVAISDKEDKEDAEWIYLPAFRFGLEHNPLKQ